MHSIYLAGPGYVSGGEKAKTVFAKAQNYLMNRGFHVVNMVSCVPPSATVEEAMIVCTCMLSLCDAILMLNGWESSNGAMVEKKYAEENNIPVFFDKESVLEAYGTQ